MRLISRLILPVLAFSALSVAGLPLFADLPPGAPQATAGTPAPAATQSGKGTIVKVDGDAGTIELRITDAQGKNAMTLVLTVTAATKITRNKASATANDLKPGDKASYSETPGSDPSAGTALTIDASKPKGPSKKGQNTGN
jgi:hypothetical protein